MSQLIYSGIELSMIKTNVVQRTAIYSPDDSEYMYTEFLIDIVATYSPSSLATSYSSAGVQEKGHLPMTTDAAIRHHLMQPRRGLLFAEGGLTIVEVQENVLGEAIDAKNGPQPISCDIRRITGSRLWYVSYSIKTWLVECPFTSTAENPIASARYSRQEDLDDDYISTLTTRGIAFFRSDILADLGTNADEYRNRLIPPTLLGYKRVHLQFMLSSDGTSVEWITVDVEQKQDLGFLPGTAGSVGITNMSLTYNVSSLNYGAEFKMAWGSIVNVEVSATGQKNSNNLDILRFCVTAAVNRLARVWREGILSNATISDNFFDHQVMLSLTFTIAPSDEEGMIDLVVPIVGFVGEPILVLDLNVRGQGGDNPFPPFSKGTRGHAAYQLAVKAFATACFSEPDQNTDDTGTVVPPGSYTQPSYSGTSPSVSAFYRPTMPQSYSARQESLGRAVPNLADPPPSPPANQPNPSPQSPQQSPQRDTAKTTDTRISGLIFLPIAFNASLSPIPTPTPTPTPTPSYGGPQNEAATTSQSGSTPPSGVIIKIHRPYSIRHISGEKRQNAGLPVIPDPIPPAQRDDPDADSPLWLITSAITTHEIDLLPNGSTPVFEADYNYSLIIKYDETARTQMSYNKPSWIKTNNVFSISTEPTDMSTHGDYVPNQINEDFNTQQEEPWF